MVNVSQQGEWPFRKNFFGWRKRNLMRIIIGTKSIKEGMCFDIFLINHKYDSANIRITQKIDVFFFESLKNKFSNNELYKSIRDSLIHIYL